MIHKTRGIVFRFTRYGETSIIVTIFTEAFGLQSYIVNGVRSKTSKNKIALYQPLTLLNLVVYHRERANIERIKEIQCFHPYHSLTVDIKKATIAMFITELLNKTVKEESGQPNLFEFLVEALIRMDSLEKNEENAHLIFLIKLSRYLGFGPQFANEVLGGRITDEKTELVLQQLLTTDFENDVVVSKEQRRNLLELLLKFYQEHLENFGELKSVQVLRDVLS
jgi:DNA repair protein RecO (recombination protein O)